MCTTRTINIQTFVQCAAVLITPFTPPLPLTVTRIGRFNTIKTRWGEGGWGGACRRKWPKLEQHESHSKEGWMASREWCWNTGSTKIVQRWLQWRYMSPHKTTQLVFFRHHRYSAWQMKVWFSLLSPKWLTHVRMEAQHASNGEIYSEHIKPCHLWVAIY
jgi:hypothetical protein